MKQEKSDYEIMKNKITSIQTKNELNSKYQKETKIKITKNILHKKPKSSFKPRPYSNLLPKYNKNFTERPKIINNYNLLAIEYENNKNEKKLENSKCLSREKEINTKQSFINNKISNEINLINEINLPCVSNIKKQAQRNINNNINQEYFLTSPIKRNKNNLKDNKNKMLKNFFNNQTNRYLSPKLCNGTKNKMFLSTEKTNNRCVSPSTANNSNANTNNNSSSHFIFGNSLIANNFQRNLKSNLIYENTKSDNIQNINGNIIPQINQDNNKKITVIEYQLNQLLAKKEKQKKIKNKKEKDKIIKKNDSFNIEELYLNFTKKIDEISKESNSQIKNSPNKKENNTNTSKKEGYLNYKDYSNINIKENTYININNNHNDINHNSYFKLWLNNIDKKENIKYKNPIIKYSFLDKIINNITRKVNFVVPSSEKELELNITRVINEELLNNNIKKDFITYGYELSPERILKIKQIRNEKIQKEREREKEKEKEKEREKKKQNQNKGKMKRIKRPNSSFFLSQKKAEISKNNNNKNKNEEAKNMNNQKIQNNLKDKINNMNTNKFSLLNKNSENLSKKENLNFNYYSQTNTNISPNITEFLGDSSNKNKLDWNLISESDKEKGKILWKKLTKVKTAPIFARQNNNQLNIGNENEKLTFNYNNKNEINLDNNNKESSKGNKQRRNNLYYSYNVERINSAYIENNRKDLEKCGLNEDSDEESDDIEDIRLIRQNSKNNETSKFKIRDNQIRFSTQKLEKLENINKFKNEKDFDNNVKYNNLYDNDNRISEDEEGIEEEEEEENEEDNEIMNRYNNKRKIINRNKTNIFKNKYKDKNKIFKKEKHLVKDKNKNIINNKKNPKSKKAILSMQKMNKYYNKKNKNQDLIGLSNYAYNKINKRKKKSKNNFHNYKIKIKYNPKKKSKNKKNKTNNNEINEELYLKDISLNSSDLISKKTQSQILENYNTIYNNFNPTIFSEDEKQNLSEEKNEEFIIRKLKIQLVKQDIINKREKPGLLFDKLVKNYHYKEDEKMNSYYNELFSKYDKDINDDIIDINIFGINLKIKKKTQENFYNKFINKIKSQNKIKREQYCMNQRLSVILDRFNKNKNKEEEIENKNNKKFKKRKNKTNVFKNHLILFNKKIEKETKLKSNNKENEYDKDFFWGVKIDSVKELEKKKEEVLLRLKHDIKYKIQEGVFNQSEMDNFLKFQKRINELTLERINNRVYIKQLEQGFNSFEEELRMHEEKKKNERRINSFIDSMNFDLYRRYELKKAIEKYFCHPVDFKNKNFINELSPVHFEEKHKSKNINNN